MKNCMAFTVTRLPSRHHAGQREKHHILLHSAFPGRDISISYSSVIGKTFKVVILLSIYTKLQSYRNNFFPKKEEVLFVDNYHYQIYSCGLRLDVF